MGSGQNVFSGFVCSVHQQSHGHTVPVCKWMNRGRLSEAKRLEQSTVKMTDRQTVLYPGDRRSLWMFPLSLFLTKHKDSLCLDYSKIH